MIAFIGDVHRAFDRLAGAVAGLPTSVEIAIQVGDLGLHQDDLGPTAPGVPPLARQVYYVTGNHDHEPSYRGIVEPTEMAPNLVYVPGEQCSSWTDGGLPSSGAEIQLSTELYGGTGWTGGLKSRSPWPMSRGSPTPARWIYWFRTPHRLSFTTSFNSLLIPRRSRLGKPGRSLGVPKCFAATCTKRGPSAACGCWRNLKFLLLRSLRYRAE